ncbi:MAG: hypothetical protein HZB19_07160 [Chloroflexi bacterium]|nr:hypothetical protein [Chloroflexota bacterium]
MLDPSQFIRLAQSLSLLQNADESRVRVLEQAASFARIPRGRMSSSKATAWMGSRSCFRES